MSRVRFPVRVETAQVLARVVERADLRMGQAGNGLRFPLKTGAALRVRTQFSRKYLDGDRAREPGVAG